MIDYLNQNPRGYSGTLKKLLGKLDYYRSNRSSWVDSPRGLSEALKRQAPALRTVGIDVKFDPHRKIDGYHVQIFKLSKNEHHEHHEHYL